jgi:hypothetical protein
VDPLPRERRPQTKRGALYDLVLETLPDRTCAVNLSAKQNPAKSGLSIFQWRHLPPLKKWISSPRTLRLCGEKLFLLPLALYKKGLPGNQEGLFALLCRLFLDCL